MCKHALSRSTLQAHHYHILHYDGHAALDEGQGCGLLFLHDKDDDIYPLTDEMLANYFRGSSIQLAILAGCKTASQVLGQQFAGVAQQLIRCNPIPAIIAMQYAIEDDAVAAFVRGFYGALLERKPLEIALVDARLKMRTANPNQSTWLAPVLFMKGGIGDHRVGEPELESSAPSSTFTLLQDKNTPDLGTEIEKAAKVDVLGASLHSTTIRYYANFKQALANGASLRVLVCEPTSEVLSMLAFRTYTLREPSLLQRAIVDHLFLINNLKSDSVSPDNCKSRTIPLVIPYGLIRLEQTDGFGKIYVKLMPFRVAGGHYPMFELSNHRNKDWYEFFSDQFEALWLASKEA